MDIHGYPWTLSVKSMEKHGIKFHANPSFFHMGKAWITLEFNIILCQKHGIAVTFIICVKL